ncbi:MAG: chloride channel protein [candidate division KSB1 bacterium]|jgi:CIC family chloride channel protein|nr:chloride channel protein [candidate division KSB1 bacterium]
MEKTGYYIRKYYRAFLDYTEVSQSTYTIILACIVGILAGFGAVGFRKLIEFIQNLSIGHPDQALAVLGALPWYIKVLVPLCGSAIVGPLVYFMAREAKGHGVPEVMHDVALKNGVIRPRVVVVKSLASAITIGTGGSVGREGPIVQIGSAIGSTIGQWLKVTPEKLKVLVGCGAAAGIAATFNAPIAGAFFALEVILGNFALPSFSPIIIASVIATAISRAFLGNYPAFIVPQYSLVSAWEIGLYAIFGIIAGVVAILFSKSVYKSEDLFDSLKMPEYLKNLIGGLFIGIMIIFIPHVYGVGYETIDIALSGELIWYSALGLLLVKIMATSMTLGSGGSGGIFAPSLFLGAVAGSAFGNLVNSMFPNITADSGAYAMVGMGAVVAGATHAPITAILILFELTNDYKIILALMVACTLSTVVAKKLSEDSIYSVKLRRRGINLHHGREEIIMRSFSVGDAMKADAPVIMENASFEEIIRNFMQSHEPYYYVINGSGELQGLLYTHEIKSVLNDKNLNQLVIAKDMIDETRFRSVMMKNNLAECMDAFSKVPFEHLPVVESEHSRKLVGSISKRDVFELYNREILRKEVLGVNFVSEQSPEQKRSRVSIPKEYAVEYLSIPSRCIGRSIKEMDIRANYNVSIIAIKERSGRVKPESEIPSPGRKFKEGDILIVVGKESDIARLKSEKMTN